MKKIKRWLAPFLAAALLLTGCGSGNTEGQQAESGKTPAGTQQADMETAGEKMMGRYLETEIALPETLENMAYSPRAYLQKLDGGELALFELAMGLYISGDNGETWEFKDTPWYTEMWENGYIDEIAMAPDGGMAVIFSLYEEEDEENGEESPSDAEEEDSSWTTIEETEYHPVYFYADAEGNKKEIVYTEQDTRLCGFWFDKESRLYATDLGNDFVYQVNTEDGSLTKLFEAGALVDEICVTAHYIIAFTSEGVDIYDREAEMLTDESAVFQDYIKEKLGNLIGASAESHAVVAIEGEQEDVIYFACSLGVYRYVMGGTVVEQIIDGTVSSFGDPSMSLYDMVALPDNEFAVLYGDLKLYRYTYDPDVPTISEKQLSVYSLTENYAMRQAVSLYQKEHQDVYIRYEVGMTGEDGVTGEDAIKKLNTEIMSGSGPDILVLDGLPAASYKEKGVLADMSAVIEGLEGEDSPFPNLVEACREDGKIYAFPMRIQLPMVAGRAADVEKIKDLSTLADIVEQRRKEEPEGDILGLLSEEELLYTLGQVCSGAWTKDEKTVDKEALTEFLREAARIYQAETAGMSAEELEEYRRERAENFSETFSSDGRYYATLSTKAINIAMGEQKLAAGKVYRVDFDFDVLTTLEEKEEDMTYGTWQGQVKDGFIPNCMAGVCSGSVEKEGVLEFYRFLYGKEVQKMDMSGGFPVNMAALDTFRSCPRGEKAGGGIAISDAEGNVFSLDLKWTDEAGFARLEEMIRSASRISAGDAAIEKAVYEIGPNALNGSMSVEEAVEEIMKKSAIYLAE